MITFIILAALAIIMTVLFAWELIGLGVYVLYAVGDLIVCAVIIWLIVKCIEKVKSKNNKN